MDPAHPRPIDPSTPPADAAATKQRTLSSTELFQGTKEVLIAHGTQIYRLRLTRHGKLILQK